MKQFYVGLAGILEKDNKFLILKRSPEKDFEPNLWESVTGRLEADEEPSKGIIREIEEETGIKAEVIMPIDTGFFYRGSKEFPMVFIAFWCRYVKGKEQLSWEHTEFKWIDIDQAIENNNLEHFRKMFLKIKFLKKHLPSDIDL